MNEDDSIITYSDLKADRIKRRDIPKCKKRNYDMHKSLGITAAKQLVIMKLMDEGLSESDAKKVSEGYDVHVAILNTGIDECHPDIAGALSAERGINFVNWKCGGTRKKCKPLHTLYNPNNISCEGYHGISVAGIIASNQFGIIKESNFQIVRVCDENGHGSRRTIAQGFEHVGQHRNLIDLVNMSIGLNYIDTPKEVSDELEDICADICKYMILVAAVGHDDFGPSIPSTFDTVLGVGATCRTSTDPDYYTWWESSSMGNGVDIVAPGVDILGLDSKQKKESNYKLAYARMTGTSAATPIITGILGIGIALVKKRNELFGISEPVDYAHLQRLVKETASLDRIILPEIYSSKDDACTKRSVAGAGRVNAYEFTKRVIEEYFNT